MEIRSLGHGETALVFVHGFLCRPQDWQFQADRFADRFQVTLCRLPGHDGLPVPEKVADITELGVALVHLLHDQPSKRFILIGHSMGTRIVLEAARHMRDAVAGVVLIDGSTIGTNSGPSEITDPSTYIETVDNLINGMFLGANPEWRWQIEASARSVDPAFGLTLFNNVVAWDRQHFLTALTDLQRPLLVIQSTELTAAGRRQLRQCERSSYQNIILSKVKDAFTSTITGADHFCQMGRPAEVNGEIESFLQKTVP